MKITSITYNSDGTTTQSVMEINDPELDALLERARTEWQELADAGTPYWCIHENRSVIHPSAYWRDDDPTDPIHRKHGVLCRDCGGYIQEG
jgi:hypothetical protein